MCGVIYPAGLRAHSRHPNAFKQNIVKTTKTVKGVLYRRHEQIQPLQMRPGQDLPHYYRQ